MIEERTVRVWNGTITSRIKTTGKGPPVVFLHGGYGLRWDGFLDRLAESRTVFAPEHPGTSEGDPDAIKALDNFWDLVLYYYELFDKLGLEAPAVVGHSFGGMVACELAATNPRRVSRLVVLDALGLWRDDAPVRNYMVMAQSELAGLMFHDPDGPVAREVFAKPEDPEAQMDADIRTTWALGCTGKFIWPIPDRGLKKRLHRIAAPTLIIWGKQDGLVPPVYAREFAQRIANSRVEMVDQAAHMPHLEQLESVSRMVGRFLDG